MTTDALRRAWLAPLTLLAVFALLAWRFALLRQTDTAIAEWQLLWQFWQTGAFDSSWLGINYLAYYWRPLIACFAVLVHFTPDLPAFGLTSIVYEWWQALYYTAVIAYVQRRVSAVTNDAPLAAAAALLLAAVALALPHLSPLTGVALLCAAMQRPRIFLTVALLYFADAGHSGTLAGAAALGIAGMAGIRHGSGPRARLYLGTGIAALVVLLLVRLLLPEHGFWPGATWQHRAGGVHGPAIFLALVLTALAVAAWPVFRHRAQRARDLLMIAVVLMLACGWLLYRTERVAAAGSLSALFRQQRSPGASAAVPREVAAHYAPPLTALEGHDPFFVESEIFYRPGSVQHDAVAELRLCRRLGELVQRGIYHVADCRDGTVRLTRVPQQQDTMAFFALLDARLRECAGVSAARPAFYATDTAVIRPEKVRPDGVVIPLLAGVAQFGSTTPLTALSLTNDAGDSVRLPFSDRRFTTTVFVPLELLHEGENDLRPGLWHDSACVAETRLTVRLDLTPPVLAEKRGALVATDEASALRVLAWQPAHDLRPLAVGFHRRQLINAWAHFWRDAALSARRSFSIDPDDLEDGDLLWLEDEAGNAATYAREDGAWQLLGTRNFLHVDKPAGLPAHWDLPAPACF